MRAPKVRYCPYCAERLAPGASVCPMCGRAADGEGNENGCPRQPRSQRLLSGAVSLLFAAALLFSVALLPILNRTPRERFIKYNFHVIPEPAAAGTYTLTASSDDPALSAYLRGSRITLKYALQRRGFILNLGLDLMSSPVLSAALTFDAPVIGAYVPQLKDVYYTADLTKLLDNLGFILPEETMTRPPSVTRMISIVARYRSVFRSFVREEELEFEEDVPVTLASGEEITADLYTFTPSPRALRSMLRELSWTLDEDRDMLELFTYFADLGGSGIPGKKGREALLELSDFFYDNADSWSRLLDTPLTWTIAAKDGAVRNLTAVWGDLTLILEPVGDGVDILCRHPAAPFLEGITFHLGYAPGNTASVPDAVREDITDYSLLRLLSLARELSDNVGADITYAFGDILEILGL